MPIINPNSPAVIICTSCGRGFLVMPRSEGVDLDPIWRWAGAGREGGVCGGEIKIVDRTFAENVAKQYEQIGGDEWLQGKRPPS